MKFYLFPDFSWLIYSLGIRNKKNNGFSKSIKGKIEINFCGHPYWHDLSMTHVICHPNNKSWYVIHDILRILRIWQLTSMTCVMMAVSWSLNALAVKTLTFIHLEPHSNYKMEIPKILHFPFRILENLLYMAFPIPK